MGKGKTHGGAGVSLSNPALGKGEFLPAITVRPNLHFFPTADRGDDSLLRACNCHCFTFPSVYSNSLWATRTLLSDQPLHHPLRRRTRHFRNPPHNNQPR